MNRIKILLADDHTILRTGLVHMLEKHFDVVGQASTGEEAISLALHLKPDVIIMDVNMPDLDGIEATKQIRKKNPVIKVLMLTMYSDKAFLKAALEAGASGYVLKKAADTELITAVNTIIKGESYIYPTLVQGLLSSNWRKENSYNEVLLSQREKEVLKYIALGHTHQEIADKMFVSVKTVETYKGRIAEKLNIKKRSDYVRYAMQHNLISE